MGRIDKTEVGYRQQMVLNCIWDLGGSATVSDISKCLKEQYDVTLSGSAINTMIIILINKGLLQQANKVRQAYVYETVLDRTLFQQRELERVRKLSFGGSTAMMAGSLLDMSGVTEEDCKKIAEMSQKKMEEMSVNR